MHYGSQKKVKLASSLSAVFGFIPQNKPLFFWWWMTGVSDLVGELQEIKSATSTSTAADLLKQGAGWGFMCLDSDLQTLLSSAPNVYTNLCFLPPHKQACNVLYLNSVETESLTGPEAVSKATKCTLSLNPRPAAAVVHFKVSAQGITLTDNKRRYNVGYIVFLASLLWLLPSTASFLIKLN